MNPFPHSPKCRRGRTIKTVAALVAAIELQVSVWFSTANRPIPSAIVRGWQLHYVINQVACGNLATVIRPQKPAVLP